jgi:hypothetical protein
MFVTIHEYLEPRARASISPLVREWVEATMKSIAPVANAA